MVRSQFGSIRFLRFINASGTCFHQLSDAKTEYVDLAYLPIMYLWGVRVEREDLELYRVELVDRYRSLGIRIQVFVKLLKDRMDLRRRLGIGKESRFFLTFEGP